MYVGINIYIYITLCIYIYKYDYTYIYILQIIYSHIHIIFAVHRSYIFPASIPPSKSQETHRRHRSAMRSPSLPHAPRQSWQTQRFVKRHRKRPGNRMGKGCETIYGKLYCLYQSVGMVKFPTDLKSRTCSTFWRCFRSFFPWVKR